MLIAGLFLLVQWECANQESAAWWVAYYLSVLGVKWQQSLLPLFLGGPSLLVTTVKETPISTKVCCWFLPVHDDTTDRDKWNLMIILCLKWAFNSVVLNKIIMSVKYELGQGLEFLWARVPISSAWQFVGGQWWLAAEVPQERPGLSFSFYLLTHHSQATLKFYESLSFWWSKSGGTWE